MTMPDFAPEDLEPPGPMLAKTPAFAMGPSDAMYESAVCATHRAAKLTRLKRVDLEGKRILNRALGIPKERRRRRESKCELPG